MRSKLQCRAIAAAIVIGVGGAAADARATGAESLVERGEYLSQIMDCRGCHTAGALAGRPDPERDLAGSDIGFQIPGLGVFYPSNLTPDEATGLGGWSAEEIVLAVRSGLRPDGRQLAPAMPWAAYSALSEEDAEALVAYLKSLEPVSFKAPGPFGPDETPTAPYLTVVAPK